MIGNIRITFENLRAGFDNNSALKCAYCVPSEPK